MYVWCNPCVCSGWAQRHDCRLCHYACEKQHHHLQRIVYVSVFCGGIYIICMLVWCMPELHARGIYVVLHYACEKQLTSPLFYKELFSVFCGGMLVPSICHQESVDW